MKLSKFLSCLMTLGCVAGSSLAQATVGHEGLPSEQTPILVSEFSRQYEQFKAQSDSGDLKYFYVRFKQAQAEEVYQELRKILRTPGIPTDMYQLVFSEFDRLLQSLRGRGYEPSTETYWAPAKELTISYFRDRGPEAHPHPVNNLPIEYYMHSMKFELWLNFQRRGRQLEEGEVYPRAVLHGLVFLRCEQPFAQCNVANVSFDEAGLRYESIPGSRGGNSSAGGNGRQ